VTTLRALKSLSLNVFDRCQLLDLCVEKLPNLSSTRILDRYRSLNYTSETLQKYMITHIAKGDEPQKAFKNYVELI
jgi:hypothetical protein